MSDLEQARLERGLAGQYEIMRLLGRGGMGAVYLAREQALDRLVAIKVLPPEERSARTRKRFQREARTAARLTHPNIVPLHTFGEVEGMLYYVMAHVQGESLGDRMRREGKIAEAEARAILAEIADALDYAHHEGVVHRDIKPGNILIVDESGRPMLTDFGIARRQAAGDTITETGVVVGTPHYMSPEQALGEKHLDGRSDLYSLGVVGYQLLTGRLPFSAESPRALLRQQVTKEPPSLRLVEPSVSEDLAAIIARCLAKKRDDRWPDCGAFRDALTRAAGREDDLPEELAALDARWVWVAEGEIVCAYLAWALYVAGDMKGLPGGDILLAVALGLPFIFFAQPLGRVYEGQPLGKVLRVFFREPVWWSFWYPEPLRRPEDVWDRLPKPVKRLNSLGGMLFLAGGIALPVVIAAMLSPTLAAIVGRWPLVACVLLVAAILCTSVAADRLGRRYSVSSRDIHGLVFGPRTRRLLGKPEIARILEASPPPARPVVSVTESPGEYMRAIAELARMPTGPLHDVGKRAVTGGRQLVAAIQELDAEVGRSADETEPGSVAELESKLASLGEADEGEPADRRLLREYLRTRIERVLNREAHLADCAARRSEFAVMLSKLWQGLTELTVQQDPDSPATKEIADRIRALCREIEAGTER